MRHWARDLRQGAAYRYKLRAVRVGLVVRMAGKLLLRWLCTSVRTYRLMAVACVGARTCSPLPPRTLDVLIQTLWAIHQFTKLAQDASVRRDRRCTVPRVTARALRRVVTVNASTCHDGGSWSHFLSARISGDPICTACSDGVRRSELVQFLLPSGCDDTWKNNRRGKSSLNATFPGAFWYIRWPMPLRNRLFRRT